MKKQNITKQVLLMLLIIIGSSLKAQIEFAPVGAEWHYERQYMNYETWAYEGITYDRFRSLNVVEINGWQCKEIELFQNIDCNGNVNPYYETRYINQDGDKIYEVIDGERYLLYDFSKQVGEYWIITHYNQFSETDTVYVKEINEITLDDGTTRRMFVTSSDGIGESPVYCTNIIEGIGPDRSLFPFYELVGPPPCRNEEIRCYYENDNYLIKSDIDCDYEITYETIEEKESKNITIIPTVFSNNDVISIESDSEIKDIKMIDMIGRNVNVIMNQTNEMSCQISINQNCNSGIYLIVVKTEKESYYKKVILRD